MMPPIPTAARTLMAGIVDYAGLFPPAALDMASAAAEYEAAKAGPDAWMLGRFVVPAARLLELEPHVVKTAAAPWAVSAIVRDGSSEDIDAVTAFNQRASQRAIVDCVECRPGSIEGIDWIDGLLPRGCDIYIEVPLEQSMHDWFARISEQKLRAKIRTGGVTAEAFPSAALIAAFLDEAIRRDVPFKATAGLHHAVRGSHRLTYAPDSASAPMYGYLNVFLAAAALSDGHDRATAERILLNDDSSSLTFAPEAVHWNGLVFSTALLASLRTVMLTGFGSCSFREPSEELHALVHRA